MGIELLGVMKDLENVDDFEHLESKSLLLIRPCHYCQASEVEKLKEIMKESKSDVVLEMSQFQFRLDNHKPMPLKIDRVSS